MRKYIAKNSNGYFDCQELFCKVSLTISIIDIREFHKKKKNAKTPYMAATVLRPVTSQVVLVPVRARYDMPYAVLVRVRPGLGACRAYRSSVGHVPDTF